MAIGPNGLHACLLYLLHRSSVVSSRPDPRLDDTPFLFVEVYLDANNDTVTSSTSQATPVSVSYFSQKSMNVQASAKRLSSWRVPVLSPSPRNTVSSLMHVFPPTTLTSYRPLTVALDATERLPMPAPRASCLRWTSSRTSGPRSSWSIPPALSTNDFSTRRMPELKGVGGWSQGNMEAILHEGQSLGIPGVGMDTGHRMEVKQRVQRY